MGEKSPKRPKASDDKKARTRVSTHLVPSCLVGAFSSFRHLTTRHFFSSLSHSLARSRRRLAQLTLSSARQKKKKRKRKKHKSLEIKSIFVHLDGARSPFAFAEASRRHRCACALPPPPPVWFKSPPDSPRGSLPPLRFNPRHPPTTANRRSTARFWPGRVVVVAWRRHASS